MCNLKVTCELNFEIHPKQHQYQCSCKTISEKKNRERETEKNHSAYLFEWGNDVEIVAQMHDIRDAKRMTFFSCFAN